MRIAGVALLALGLAAVSRPAGLQSVPSPALLVAEKGGGMFALVDPTKLTVVGHAPAAPTPHEVATDGTVAYLSNQGGTAITVIDLATLKPLAGIETGAIGEVHGLAVWGGKLYFTSERARTVARYDPATHAIDWLFGGGQARTHLIIIIVSADGSKIFTTNIGSGTLSIIERVEPAAARGAGRAGGRGGAPAPPDWNITAVTAGAGAEGIALSPDEKTVWTANVPAHSLSVIDVTTKQLVDTIPVTTTYSNRLKFTPDGRYVLVSDLRGSEVTVFDAATHREIRRVPVGGGTEGLLVAPDGSRAFVSAGPLNKIVVIDLKTFSVTGEITGLQGPDGLAWLAR
jgi:YVTN family beta-propeller protein